MLHKYPHLCWPTPLAAHTLSMVIIPMLAKKGMGRPLTRRRTAGFEQSE